MPNSRDRSQSSASTPPLRVLHITAPAPYGGLETVVTALASGHVRRGHHIDVVAVASPGHGPSPFVNGLLEQGVSVHQYSVRRRAYVDERRRIRALCDSKNPDVVHTHGYRSDVFDAPVARALGIATVSTVHGRPGGSVRSRLYGWVQRRALRRTDAVVAVSRELHTDLVRDPRMAGRLHLIPNADPGGSAPLSRAAAREFLDLPAGGFHVGWVGRISEEKGLDVFLASLASLADLAPVVSIVGDGPDGARLRGESRRLRSPVRWHGSLPEAARVLPAFDVLVLSSRREGTPMVLLEAAANGVPVVATDVGGVREAIGAQDALLIPPESPRKLAEAIRQVHEQPRAAEERARRAGERVRASADRWLGAYEELYNGLRRTAQFDETRPEGSTP